MKNLWLALCIWCAAIKEPFDIGGIPDSEPAIDSDFTCPDTQPTSPGALDSDLARLQ